MRRLEPVDTKEKQNLQLKFYRRYGWCSCGFGVAWALLTCCFLIINIIVFIEPQWIGDTKQSPGVGYVGLFQLCEFVNFGADRVCDGKFQDFSSILTTAFRASTWFIGVSCLVIMLCIFLFLLFLCVYATYVYIICGVLQIVSTVFMFLGCVIFPAGWDHMYVRRICGTGVGKHNIGDCEMRWAYILAIVGIFDILMLAILAFVLACHQRRSWTNTYTVKKPKERLAPADSHDGTTTLKSSKALRPKGYVVALGVPGSQYAASQAPPSYYGGPAGAPSTGSRLGGRSGMYGSQPVYIVDQQGGPSEYSARRGPTPAGGPEVGGRYRSGSTGYRQRHDSI